MKKFTLIFTTLALAASFSATAQIMPDAQTSETQSNAETAVDTIIIHKMNLHDCMLYALEHSTDVLVKQTETPTPESTDAKRS